MFTSQAIRRERKRLAELREKLRNGRETGKYRPGRLEGAALRMTITATADFRAMIDDYAERRGISRSVLIREAALFGIDRWLEEDDARRAAEPMIDPGYADASLGALPGRAEGVD